MSVAAMWLIIAMLMFIGFVYWFRLLVSLIVIVSSWPHSRNWGYVPAELGCY